MRHSKFLASTLGLLLATGTHALACELCAVYAGSHGLGDPAHGWFVGAAEQFTTFGGLQFGGNEIPNPANQSLETSTTQLILGYSFNERFSLQANIPYIHRTFRRPTPLGIEDGTESGLGDAILLGQLLLWQKNTGDSIFTGSLLGGFKFPTGSTTRLKQETLALDATAITASGTHGISSTTGGTTASGIHGYDLTLGSGSVDARLGASIYYRHKRAFFSGAFQYAICTEGAYGYRFANDLTWDGGPGFYLLSEPSCSLSIEAAISGEHKGADTYKDQPVDSTGFTTVYLGPKINFTWKDRLSAHLGVDIPVSIQNSGLQAVPGTRVRAGVTWLLGPDSGSNPRENSPPRSIAMDGTAPPIWTHGDNSRFYGGIEYLLWWVKDAPLGVPLVSTGPIDTTHHGYVDRPDTTILYGAPFSPAKGGRDSQPFAGLSGARLTLGGWLDKQQRFAIEGRGFALETQTAGFEVRSDLAGQPVINVPVLNNVSYSAGRGVSPSLNEDGLPAALPSDPHRLDGNAGVFAGGVKISNSVQLWGMDLNGVVNFYRSPSWELSGLLGARYLDLSEAFNLTYDSMGVTGVYAGRTGVAFDSFKTRNQFYGATLGLRGCYSRGPLSAECTGRVALGTSHRSLNIAGGYTQLRNYGTAYESGPEGIFAQPANEGRTSSDRFAAVPEVQFKIGYAFSPRWRMTIGYDFLYYSSVLRPGDQINRALPKGQTFNQGKTTPSTTSPARLSNTGDFFAHGLNVGMEFRF